MISKYKLILFTILLTTAAISGCTENNTTGDDDSTSAYAQTSGLDFIEQSFEEIQKIIETADNPLDGTDINSLASEIMSKTAFVKTTTLDNGMEMLTYKKGKTTIEIIPGEEIKVIYNNGKIIRANNNHGNIDLDVVTGYDADGNEVFSYPPTPTTAQASSTQKQLADAPSEEPTSSNQALYKQITNPDVIKGAFDQPLDNYRIPASILGTPDKEASNGKRWKNVAGFDTYQEYIDDDGKVEKISINTNDGTIISLANYEKTDENIDIVWARLSDGAEISLP